MRFNLKLPFALALFVGLYFIEPGLGYIVAVLVVLLPEGYFSAR